MKKLLAFVLSIVMLFGTFAISTFAAGEAREVEDNNTAAKATSFTTTVVGALKTRDDVDYYKFQSTKNYFTIDFAPNDMLGDYDVGTGWNVEVYDEKFECIWSKANIESTASTFNIPFKGMIYVKVYTKYSSWDPTYVAGIDYRIKVTQVTNTKWEKEYNNDFNTANTITVNQSHVGNLYKRDDIDCYKFTSTADGFTIKFAPANMMGDYDFGTGWTVEVYNSKFESVWTASKISSATSFNLPFKGTMYVKVYTTYSGWDPTYVATVDYSIKVSTFKGNWEKEYNNELKKASSIKANTSYSGNLYTLQDVDYYKITPTGDYFVVNFNMSNKFIGTDVEHGWNIQVLDRESNLVWYAEGVTNSMKTPKLSVKDVVYVKITANHSSWYPSNTKGVDYVLKVSQTTNSKWEDELWFDENGIKTAEYLKKDDYRKGTLLNFKSGNTLYYDDIDPYKIKTVAAGTVTINFSRGMTENDGDGIKIELKNSAGNVVDGFIINDKQSGKLSGIKVKKGTYYITVSPVDMWDMIDAKTEYKISYSFKLATPSVKKLTASAKTMKVTWNKKGDVEGYELQYATNKSFKNAKKVTISKNSTVQYTLKKLSLDKKYYVRIRTFKKIDGKKCYSSWSATKAATTYKLNTPTLKKLTASKKAIKATWNRDKKVDSYEISYSTSKSFKNAKVVKIAKNKTVSTTLKKLTGGKKYYVRIRTVKKVDGVKRYSKWSSVKNSTAKK